MSRGSFRTLRVGLKNQIFSRLAGNRVMVPPRPVDLAVTVGQRILVLAPHPDDEIIGAGGTLLAHRAVGNEMDIHFFFPDAARRDEMAAVCARLGLNVLASLADLKLQNYAIIFCPSMLEAHPEHQKVSLWLSRNLNRCGARTEILQYEVWTPLVPSHIFCIDAFETEKMVLLEEYQSQLQEKNYVAASRGLAAYRALQLPGKSGNAAEVFWRLSVPEYEEAYHWLRRARL